MQKHYINAVVQLLLQGKDVSVVLTNLEKTLKAKGHTSIHLAILRGVTKQLERTSKTTTSTITVARHTDVAKLKEAIEASLLKIGGTTSNAAIMEDATLIGGYVATHNSKSIDASYKNKLVTLYRSITK
jgi:F0F1-type ATP synthase delta subunit